jgi:1-acyl-sn-glycerol-3-phosphate acyltransferase
VPDQSSRDAPDTAVTVQLTPAAATDPERLFREQLPGLEPDRDVTDWGRSERLTSLLDATLTSFLYHYWFRVEAEDLDNVPATGGALLVANRAGQLRADAVMIARAVREEHRVPRPVHLAGPSTFADIPGLGMVATKLGAVTDHPANLHRLLFDEKQLVLAFPEVRVEGVKPLRSRYRLRRFEGLAFVDIALRAGVPIVPVAVVGAEEATPSLATLGPLSRILPVRVGSRLPLPARFRVRFLQPVRTDELGREAIEDRALVGTLAEDVRALIQENLYEMVAARRSVWLG